MLLSTFKQIFAFSSWIDRGAKLQLEIIYTYMYMPGLLAESLTWAFCR